MNNAPDWLPSVLVGTVLVPTGLLMLWSHLKTWRRQKNDSGLDEFDRRHYHARFRRRVLIAGLLTTLGVLIPAGDVLLMHGRAPGWFTAWIFVVLAMTACVILLAMADFLASRAHAQVALARVRQKQRELEDQLARFRGRQSNGRHAQD